MAYDLNKVFFCGRLTRDAESKSTKNGTIGELFSIAVNRSKDDTDYINIEFWGKTASSIHAYLLKGRQVIVEGSLRQRRWEQDGKQRSSYTVWAENIQLLNGGEQKYQTEARNVTEPKSSYDGLNGPETFDDDDIPF